MIITSSNKISYLATLAPAFMAFTASAQNAAQFPVSYNTYLDTTCSTPAILVGSIQSCGQCTPFSLIGSSGNTGNTQSFPAGALGIGPGSALISCNVWSNPDCDGAPKFSVSIGCNLVPTGVALEAIMCECN